MLSSTLTPGLPGKARLYAGLALLFMLALVPRAYSVLSVGWNWDYPGSFTLINFDEGGSCRAALGGFNYSTFIGSQTIALADAVGLGPPADVGGDAAAVKAYCHSPGHILVARGYSAVTGALTAVVVVIIGLLLLPDRPGVGWTAGALVALSGFHMSESQSATVDAPSVFFIYCFLAFMVYAVKQRSGTTLMASLLLLAAAVWSKYWVFALFAYVAVLPQRAWRYISHGIAPARVALLGVGIAVLLGLLSNSEFQRAGLYPLLGLFYLLVPWRHVHRPMALCWLLLPPLAFVLAQIELIHSYTTGGMSGAFGSSYGAIGWHKWLRNLLNLPLVLLLGLGIPACLFIPAGLRALGREVSANRAWLCLSPLLVFALYMAFVSPITYYRHYLPLLPGAALLAALGLYTTVWCQRRWFMVLFFLWPALLAVDMVGDYHRDPRIALRDWYAEHPQARVFYSYYVSPPVAALDRSRLFRPEYAQGDAEILRRADYLVLSENWYDTAFANELNGPLVHDPSRLIKTRPEYVAFYRDALAGRHPHLVEESVIPVTDFMPELTLHRKFYGGFPLFVGDLRIFRVQQ